MEKAKKNLLVLSILILATTALSLIMNCITAFTGGLVVTQLPTDAEQLGLTLDVYQILAYVTFGITLLVFLPNVFVGLRGIKMSNAPEKTKGHIIWAIILLASSVVTVLTHIPQAISAPNFNHIWTTIDKAIDVLVFGAYAYYAILVYREA